MNPSSLIDKLFEENKSIFDQTILPHCHIQLGLWKKLGYFYRLSLSGGQFKKPKESKNEVIRKLAEELSMLYSNFSDLEIVWAKAGGKFGQLSEKNNVENSWYFALIQADKGKIEDGILGILEIGLQEYPSNIKLKYINNYFLGL